MGEYLPPWLQLPPLIHKKTTANDFGLGMNALAKVSEAKAEGSLQDPVELGTSKGNIVGALLRE